MGSDTVGQKKLRSLIKKLASIRGRHTELITVYVPAGANLNVVASQIAQEQGTASNIKSKAVRKNVLGALEKVNQHLKLYRETPPNGLAIFCGNVSEKEGGSDLELWAMEPPEPMKVRIYRCDQQFLLDPLQEMVREREVYGLIVLDKSETDIGVLMGKRIDPLKHFDSLVPGKTKKGGWSQARYARIREGLLNDHLKKSGELATSFFRDMKDLRGIIIGGPGPIKDMFYKGDFLGTDVKAKVLGVVDTSYTGTYGLREVLARGEDLIAEASVVKERKLLERFFSELAKERGLAVYGIKETMRALEAGAVEILLVSEDFDANWVFGKFGCGSCGTQFERFLRTDKDLITERSSGALVKRAESECPKCQKPVSTTAFLDAIEKLQEYAEKVSTAVEIVSVDTPEGGQLREMGGIAGILRYSIG